MTAAAIIFHRLATKDYVASRRWYARRSAEAANSFEREIDAVLRQIAANPETGTRYARDFRWMKARRFPYVVFYQSLPSGVVRVLAVAHGRRRPGYWLWRAKRL